MAVHAHIPRTPRAPRGSKKNKEKVVKEKPVRVKGEKKVKLDLVVAKLNLLSFTPESTTPTKVWMDSCNFVLIRNVEQLNQVFKENQSQEYISVDTETTGLSYLEDTIVGMSFSFDGVSGYYIPFAHRVGGINVPLNEVIIAFNEFLSNYPKTQIYFNSRFDINVLLKVGYVLPPRSQYRYMDVQILSYMFDPNIGTPSLKLMSEYRLGAKMISLEDLITGRNKDFSLLSPEDGYVYASSDAIITYRLCFDLLEELFMRDPKTYKDQFIFNIDHNISYYMRYLEGTPIPFNFKLAEDYKLYLEEEIRNLAYKIYDIFGLDFDINSPKQLSNVLVTSGVPLEKKTEKTGTFATGIEIIEKFVECKGIREIIKYKEFQKSLGYVNSYVFLYTKLLDGVLLGDDRKIIIDMEDLINKGVISKLYRKLSMGDTFFFIGYQTSNVSTGRFSSGSEKQKKGSGFFNVVNVQQVAKSEGVEVRPCVIKGAVEENSDLYAFLTNYNIYICRKNCPKYPSEGEVGLLCPYMDRCNAFAKKKEVQEKRGNIRSAFIPYPGHLFLHADFKQQELKVKAFIAKEKSWIQAWDENKDIYKVNAALAYNIPYEAVTGRHRKPMKQVVLAKSYGAGPETIAAKANITVDEAKSLMAAYNNITPAGTAWEHKVIDSAKRTGFSRTYFGRTRPLGKFFNIANEKWIQRRGERQAVNSPIQGTCGDIIRMAISRFYSKDKTVYGLTDEDIFLLITVHDELNFSVNPNKIMQAVNFVKECMIFPISGWPRLLGVDISIGPNWGTQLDVEDFLTLLTMRNF